MGRLDMGLWCHHPFGYKCQEPNSNCLKHKKDFMGSQNGKIQWYVCLQTQPDSGAQPRPAGPRLPSHSKAFLHAAIHSDSLPNDPPRTPSFHPMSPAALEDKRGPAPENFSTNSGTNSDGPVWGHVITPKAGRFNS